MNKDWIDDESIKKYLLGELSEDESKAFREELAVNEELRSETEMMKLTLSVLEKKRDERVREALKQVKSEEELRAILGFSSQHTKKNVRRFIFTTTAIAASLMIFLYIGFTPAKTPETLFREFYRPLAYEQVFSRGGSELSGFEQEYLSDALKSYEEQEYEEAREKLQNFPYSIPNRETEEIRKFYLAMCYMETGKNEEAEKLFNEIAGEPTGFYKEEAIWYRALLRLLDEDRQGALSHFREIRDANGLYSKEAEKLLEEAKKTKWF